MKNQNYIYATLINARNAGGRRVIKTAEPAV